MSRAIALALSAAIGWGHQQIINAIYDDLEAISGGPGGSPIDAWPIGSVFTSTVDLGVNGPATLLGGGTWAKVGAGRVLIGQDGADSDFDVLGETPGAKTVAAAGAVAAPTFTGSALGTHAHTAGTLAPSAHAGAAVANPATEAAHTHSGSGNTGAEAAHTHAPGTLAVSAHAALTTGADSSTTGGVAKAIAQTPAAHTLSGATAAGSSHAHTSGAVGAGSAHTHTQGAVTQANDHTMSGTSQAVSAGTPAGTNSAPAFTGSPTSVVQPGLVVQFWQRTA